jgi:hypothetical protein
MFDEMPLKDDTAGQSEQLAFQVPSPLESTAQEMLVDMPQRDVTWMWNFRTALTCTMACCSKWWQGVDNAWMTSL